MTTQETEGKKKVLSFSFLLHNYLRQEGPVLPSVCLCVRVLVSRIHFQTHFGMDPFNTTKSSGGWRGSVFLVEYLVAQECHCDLNSYSEWPGA